MQILNRYIIIIIAGWLLVITGCFAGKTARSSVVPDEGRSFNAVLPNNTFMPMEWVPAGSFNMGSPDTEAGRKADESPVTRVTISKGFWMAKTEITIDQWQAVMGESMREHVIKMLNDETVYDFGGQQKKLREFMNFKQDDPDRIMANQDGRLPMYFTSWNDAIQFCHKLNEKERAKGNLPGGYEYNLPTEAQWEYACRAGTTDATFAGPLLVTNRIAPVLDSIAWYSGNSAVNYEGKKLGNAGPRNTGVKKPNAWGLQDMPGNIWEWCRDWYGPYPGGAAIDPVGPPTGTARVCRGGSWGSGANDSRSANRARNPQPEKSAWRGFRVALCAK